jgi:hypothetical protein
MQDEFFQEARANLARFEYYIAKRIAECCKEGEENDGEGCRGWKMLVVVLISFSDEETDLLSRTFLLGLGLSVRRSILGR